MQIFTVPCVCEVCGGPGVKRDYGWGNYVHTNPEICRAYLKRDADELARKLCVMGLDLTMPALLALR